MSNDESRNLRPRLHSRSAGAPSPAQGPTAVHAQARVGITQQVEEVGSGASQRPKREVLMKAQRRPEVDAIVVWKLDRWGRSLPDLIASLADLRYLGVAFVSLTEALYFIAPAGRAMIALLLVFAEFERD